MNGNTRLYRSTSDGMLGGVCAGLGNYFHIDPTIVRIAVFLLTIVTSGAFAIAYMIMWVMIPTPGSTASGPNQVVQENLNEIGAKVRGFTGGGSKPSNGGAVSNGGATPSADPPQNPNQVQLATATATVNRTWCANFAPWLIAIGAFFLVAKLGFFHGMHWGLWWPVLLVGFGIMMLMRRNHA